MMIITCPTCGKRYIVEDNDPDVILKPWPHVICECDTWIPLF